MCILKNYLMQQRSAVCVIEPYVHNLKIKSISREKLILGLQYGCLCLGEIFLFTVYM